MRLLLVLLFCLYTAILNAQDTGSSEKANKTDTRLSLTTGLILSIIPGLGAGNYYAKNYSKGITFTLLDTSLLGLSLWAYTNTKVTNYSLISLGVIPALLIIFKAIQIKTVYDDIDAYNNRYIFHRTINESN